MVKTLLLVGAVLFIAACASVGETYGPDGRVAYTLNCSGTARSWSMCMRAAGNQCGTAGYDVVDRVERSGGAELGIHRSMVISCKE